MRGPHADALLLAGWLRARLARDVQLTHEPADELEAVLVDDEPLAAPRAPAATASDLLSDELDKFVRDLVYEAAVRSAH